MANDQGVYRAGVRPAGPFYVMALLVTLVFFCGGGQRADIESLAFLRPIAVVALGYALRGMTGDQLKTHRLIIIFAIMIVALNVLHLIPLPTAIWSSLPGREFIVEIDQAANLGALWRPISMVPSAAWNSFFAMFPPLAVLMLGLRIRPVDLTYILYLIFILGLISCVLAILQINGEPDNMFYTYQVTSLGSANGLFANRNHHAVFLSCLMPMLAAFASRDIPSGIDLRLRRAVALTGILLLLPMIIATGSRAGLISLVLGLMGAASIYFRGANMALASKPKIAAGLASVAAIGTVMAFISLYFDRAVAINRLLDAGWGQDGRLGIWHTTLELIGAYFPVGSGVGSFASVYKMQEPHSLLTTVVTAHAHNDWLEVLAVAGVPGAALLAIASVAWGTAFVRWWQKRNIPREHHALAGAGLWIILLLGFASFFDYPLRVPLLSCFFCVAVLWATVRMSTTGSQE